MFMRLTALTALVALLAACEPMGGMGGVAATPAPEVDGDLDAGASIGTGTQTITSDGMEDS